MKTTEHCVGCYNNFYNQAGNSTTGKCWSLPSAKLITRFGLGVNTPMNIREAYIKVRKPSCYRRNGVVYLNEIPSYAQTRKQREDDERKAAP